MYRYTGIITSHLGRGKILGFPTINCPAPDDIPDGIYAGYVEVGEQHYTAAIFVGAAITFNEVDRQIEAHLLDQSLIINGGVTFRLIKFIRGNKKFSSAAALQKQIDQDIIAIKQCLAASSKNN